MTYKAVAALAIALAVYLAGPQMLLLTPSAANADEKQYIFADLIRLCDSVSGKQWPSYYSSGNVSIQDGRCTISDLIVFSDQICEKNDSTTVISCLRQIVRHEFEVETDEGGIDGPPCGDAGLCTYYFDFHDPEMNYQQESHICGFHIGGIAKVKKTGRVAFWGSASIKQACTQ